ncbi:uncharacterized protein MONOS_7000 [Monocercomonoides exilis]|uniref:uncharacterized protein n=1 Tax=Monocercomonoides exilis TaxID=2049356 RepID=UPI003559A233|nr:hypothetical protein MONOS_7000 [Monocercomonoides exilis]|eukprot:MONOS_7000.1-p1 / transcript=MONOS_7000.1 / gene=MONOS_7000 / organism=Monocercomonoides_exilis_PA203 / gene_product=unspecified product / transcript_product=unspecified product / location=Mono_scaffold00230:56210-56698(+) / protein_length=102 / sequence_SO=supercontig / SO=protein_coding / is_pseudo=false
MPIKIIPTTTPTIIATVTHAVLLRNETDLNLIGGFSADAEASTLPVTKTPPPTPSFALHDANWQFSIKMLPRALSTHRPPPPVAPERMPVLMHDVKTKSFK